MEALWCLNAFHHGMAQAVAGDSDATTLELFASNASVREYLTGRRRTPVYVDAAIKVGKRP